MGADIAASVPSSGVCDDLKRQLENLRFRAAILMVGTVEPRKGYEAALAAFDHLWRDRPAEAPDLVIVGKAGWKTSELQQRIRSHPQFSRRLRWFECMSDEGLCLLYDACRGLLVASRGEGWGLPIIEATMHRRHILARDLPVFREHGLPNISYFADDTPTVLGQQIIDLAMEGQRPAPFLKLPTWSESVDSLLRTLGVTVSQQHHADEAMRKAS
jgi:glycosyltransferase involved in cell wall biosynthesis